MNLCSADYTSSDLDEERTFSDSFTSSVPITCLAYTDGQIPEVRIDISSYPDGEYTLCVTSESSVQCDSEAQAQDNCFDAEPVGPGIYQGSTIGANNDGAGSCFSSPDVWYSYTPISDGLLVVTTCGGANYDTALSIHSGCPGDAGASLLACNDDWCGLQSQISLNVEAFNTYLIRVAGFSNRSGNFTLDISGPPCGGSVVTVQQDCYSFTKQGEDTIALNMPCNIPPVAVCQDVTVSAGADCTADASVDDGSYDPDGDLITLTQDPPGPYPLGNTTVTLIVSDGELLDYCQATITVTDDTPPEITLNGADVLVLECSVDSYVEQGATATDACDDDVPVTVGGDTVDASTCGMYVVIYDASDDSGNPATQVTRTVIVEDTIAPEFSLSVTPDVLWSPNHKMVLITPSWTVSDICDESPAMTLIGITMNEGDNDLGDGNTTDDIQVTDAGLIYLRAERTGKGTDRVYTITYAATDDSGNTTQDTATVTVPHDKGKSKPK